MKLDKETLLKHHFWVLLGLFVLLWMGALAMLQVSASAPLEEARKKFEDAKKSMNDTKGRRPKNPATFVPPWDEYAKVFQSKKDTVWQEAWLLQKGMITWPSSNDSAFQRVWDQSPSLADFFKHIAQDNPAAGWRSSLARREFKDSLYPDQFKDLDQIVAPAELRGGVDEIMRRVQWTTAPTIEELWLAQEDFWVRREMLGIVKSVIDGVARFEPVEPKAGEVKPAGAKARQRFRNSHWELDLIVEQRGNQMIISPKSTITNLHVSHRAQNLANPKTGQGTQFRLEQGPSTVTLRVEGEPLPWGQSAEFRRATPVDTVDLTRPFDVVQVFEWSTSPVRRVDALQPAYHSHRTAHRNLQANAKLEEYVPKDEAGPGGPGAAPGGAGPGGAGPGAGGPLANAGGKGPGGEGGNVTNLNQTPNNINRERYLQITEQCRHLPIAMLLVVDQSHIHDVLIAAANSRLRIQTTQVQFNHVRGIQPPQTTDDSGAGPVAGERIDRPGVGGAAAVAAGGFPKAGAKVPLAAQRPTPGMLKGPGGAGPAGVGPGGSAAMDDGDDPNLVEVAIYGIATLYERFPDNRTPAVVPGAPAPMGTPMPMTPMNPTAAPMPMPTPTATPKSEPKVEPKAEPGKTEPKAEPGKTEPKSPPVKDAAPAGKVDPKDAPKALPAPKDAPPKTEAKDAPKAPVKQ